MTFIDFLPPVFWVGLGLVTMAVATSILGFYAFASRKSLLSDAMSHALLPGACLGYFFTEHVQSWWVWLGAIGSVGGAVLLLPTLVKKFKLKTDVATGWILSVFFSVGVILWNILQQEGKTGLSHLFFGEAATIAPTLALQMLVVCVLVILAMMLFHRHWLAEGFDFSFAKAIGLPLRWPKGVQTFLIVLVVVSAIRITGLVLVTAWLIFPILMVSAWPQNVGKKIFLACCISAAVALLNLGISHQIPGFSIGPWWVLSMGILLSLQYLFKAIKN